MTAATVSWFAAGLAGLCAAWAALLALADEAPQLGRTLAEAPVDGRRSVPLDRALLIARIGLLLMAGVAGAQAVAWWHRPPEQALAAALLSTGFVYVVAEAVPRALASLSPRLATAATSLARRSLVVFSPLLGMLSWIEGLVQTLLPPRRRSVDRFGAARRDMLLGVLSLSETTVAEAMTPRLDVVAVDRRSEWRELVDVLRRSRHAQVPVFTDDLDNVVGILDTRSLTAAVVGTEPPPDWHALVQPAVFVPESKTLTQQLADFQQSPSDIAIVVDEFGGTSGLITREDVLEEVVGEIYGEYEADEGPPIQREGEDRLWVDGGVTIDDLAEELRVPLEREDVSTVGGLIYSELGHVPRPGEEFQLENFRVVVERVIKRRVRRVYFERRPEPSDDGGPEAPT